MRRLLLVVAGVAALGVVAFGVWHSQPDFVAIARGFGFTACDLGSQGDPLSALADALHTPGPCLINVPIAAQENVYPMVPPGAAMRKWMCGGRTQLASAG